MTAARLAADRVAAEAGARTDPLRARDARRRRPAEGAGERGPGRPARRGGVRTHRRSRPWPRMSRRFAAAGIPVAVFINRMAGPVLDLRRLGRRGRGLQRGPRPDRRAWAARATSSPRRHAAARRPPATAPWVCGGPWPSSRRSRCWAPASAIFQAAPARLAMAELLAAASADRRRVDRQRPDGLRRARGAGRGRDGAPRWWASTACPAPSTTSSSGTMLASVDFSAFNIAAIATRAVLRHLARRAGAQGDHGAGRADRPRATIAPGQVPFAERPLSRLGRDRAIVSRCADDSIRLALLIGLRPSSPRRRPPSAPSRAPPAPASQPDRPQQRQPRRPDDARRHRRGAGRRHHPGAAVQGQDRAGRAPADPRGAVRQDRRQGDGAPAARRAADADHPAARRPEARR